MVNALKIVVDEESATKNTEPGTARLARSRRNRSVIKRSSPVGMRCASAGDIGTTIAADPVQRVVTPPAVSGTAGAVSAAQTVETSAAAEVRTNTREYAWHKDQHTYEQSVALSVRLAETGKLYYVTGLGLCQIEVGKPTKRINTPEEFEAVIRENLDVTVMDRGEAVGHTIPARELRVLLLSEKMLAPLPVVDYVTPTVTYNSKWEITKPGYNAGDVGDRIFYTGKAVTPKLVPERIREFLAAMSFKDAKIDAANAAGARLTMQQRHMWRGQKPFLGALANMSHAGKDTVLDFVAGRTARKDIAYHQQADWATQNDAVSALLNPAVGMVTLGNIRADREIASQFIEGAVTSDNILLQSSRIRGAGTERANDILFSASVNRGMFSKDLANRMLPIRLEVVGDIATRKSSIDDPRHSYLPMNSEEIEAETCGLIENWKSKGCPLDTAADHPMKAWAHVVGGILKANGFEGFLGNWREFRETGAGEEANLAIIAHHAPHDKWLRPTEIADIAIREGVVKTLMGADKRETRASKARELGVLFTAYQGAVLSWKGAAEPCNVKVLRKRMRNGHKDAAWHFMFETVKPV